MHNLFFAKSPVASNQHFLFLHAGANKLSNNQSISLTVSSCAARQFVSAIHDKEKVQYVFQQWKKKRCVVVADGRWYVQQQNEDQRLQYVDITQTHGNPY